MLIVNLCWVSYTSPLCCVSLCWMSLYWVSLCGVSLCWMSLCWVSLCWLSLCWVSLCWVSNDECCYAECHYAECHYTECRYPECRYAERHSAQKSGCTICLLSLRCIYISVFCCVFVGNAEVVNFYFCSNILSNKWIFFKFYRQFCISCLVQQDLQWNFKKML